MKNRIKEFRDQYNLTQDELAGKVDVSRQTIISLEKGKYNPSIHLAHSISRKFNLAIEELFIFEDNEEY